MKTQLQLPVMPPDRFHLGDRVVANLAGQSVLGTVVEQRRALECEGYYDFVYGYLVKVDEVGVRVFTEDRLSPHEPPRDDTESGWSSIERMSGTRMPWRRFKQEQR